MSLTINQTVAIVPSLPYKKMAEAILGKKYNLSLFFVGTRRAKTINRLSRQKEYAPNVLSFPYTNEVGEIVICPEVAKREAKEWQMTPDGYIGFLFVHGLLHLKGYDHGHEMENLEKKYRKKFNLL